MAGRLGQVGLAVALAGLLVACGSSGAAPTTNDGGGGGATPGATASQGGGGGGGSSSSDPCSLLTPDQISAAISGIAFGAGDSGGDTHSCDWSHDVGGLPTTQVIVTTNEDTGLCDEGSSTALGITDTPLSGVGDKACLIAMTGLTTTITFYKGGGRGWSITASGMDVTAANVGTIEQQLAQDALGNL